jgi:twitching motility protein PilT
MKKLMRDPSLDQLVEELNRTDASRPRAVEDLPELPAPPSTLAEGSAFEALLAEMTTRGASDMLVVAGMPPVYRINGRLQPSERDPFTPEEVRVLLGAFISGKARERIEAEGALDLSLRATGMRFRINVHRQRGTFAASVRALPTTVPTLVQLELPQSLGELMKATRGLVLVCGPTGAGKTTTLAALIGEINRTAARHIITIEDPIEYEHRNASSIIEQVEVGRDTPTFATALRAALRQDPDVILVGEMRDLETVSTALTAAETGHLILATLHTADAAQAIHRIVDVFPPQQQMQIRHQLALSLNAIVCQHLVPKSDGTGRAVAVEVLLANHAVRNHIRNEKLQNLITEITLGKRQGMISLEDSLATLVRRGAITPEDARIRAPRPDELESLLRR